MFTPIPHDEIPAHDAPLSEFSLPPGETREQAVAYYLTAHHLRRAIEGIPREVRHA